MIAELAEPRISADVPRPFSCVHGGVWEQDYIQMKYMKISLVPKPFPIFHFYMCVALNWEWPGDEAI